LGIKLDLNHISKSFIVHDVCRYERNGSHLGGVDIAGLKTSGNESSSDEQKYYQNSSAVHTIWQHNTHNNTTRIQSHCLKTQSDKITTKITLHKTSISYTIQLHSIRLLSDKVTLAHFQMTQCGSRRFLHKLVTMAILAFKIIRNLLIYAVFVYRSDRFLLHGTLRRTYRSNLDKRFVFIVVFAFRICPFYVLPKISLFWQNNIYFNVLDS